MQEGTQAFTKGEYEKAANQFLHVMTIDPQNVDAVLANAVARFATGDYSAAGDSVRQGIALLPDVVNADFDIRDRYGVLKDFDDHYRNLAGHVLDQPGDIEAWVTLGFVQHFTGLREASERTFNSIKEWSERDRELADTFLNANPPATSPAGQGDTPTDVTPETPETPVTEQP
jgi:thioredoxin-like negative regulator of GroEL